MFKILGIISYIINDILHPVLFFPVLKKSIKEIFDI